MRLACTSYVPLMHSPYACLQLVDQYFDAGGLAGEPEADQFLKDYIMNKAWVDETEQDGYVPSYQQVSVGIKALFVVFNRTLEVCPCQDLSPSVMSTPRSNKYTMY